MSTSVKHAIDSVIEILHGRTGIRYEVDNVFFKNSKHEEHKYNIRANSNMVSLKTRILPTSMFIDSIGFRLNMSMRNDGTMTDEFVFPYTTESLKHLKLYENDDGLSQLTCNFLYVTPLETTETSNRIFIFRNGLINNIR